MSLDESRRNLGLTLLHMSRSSLSVPSMTTSLYKSGADISRKAMLTSEVTASVGASQKASTASWTSVGSVGLGFGFGVDGRRGPEDAKGSAHSKSMNSARPFPDGEDEEEYIGLGLSNDGLAEPVEYDLMEEKDEVRVVVLEEAEEKEVWRSGRTRSEPTSPSSSTTSTTSFTIPSRYVVDDLLLVGSTCRRNAYIGPGEGGLARDDMAVERR